MALAGNDRAGVWMSNARSVVKENSAVWDISAWGVQQELTENRAASGVYGMESWLAGT